MVQRFRSECKNFFFSQFVGAAMDGGISRIQSFSLFTSVPISAEPFIHVSCLKCRKESDMNTT